MPAKKVQGIPKTASQAKKLGYKKVKMGGYHDAMSHAEKKKFVLVKPATAASPHMVCHYDPNTGTYTNCTEENS